MRYMRFLNFLNNQEKHQKIGQQLLLICLAGFLSFTVFANNFSNNTVVANNAHATHLIQQYLKTHPLTDIYLIKQQEQIADKLNQLQQLQQKSTQKLFDQITMQTPKETALPKIYPIRSEHLIPGKIKSRTIQTALPEPIPEPIFIVGDDALSKTWMNHYQRRLLSLHAKGFVVNVASKEKMAALRKQFSTLPLMPMPGDAFAQWLHLKHYPVLISNNLIEQ